MKAKKNRKKLLIRFACVCLMLYFLAPILICVVYSLIATKIEINVTTECLVNYYSALFGGIIPLCIAFISLYQSKNTNDIQEIIEIDKQRNNAFPDLYILIPENDDFEYLTIKNYSKNIANNLHITMTVNGEYLVREFDILPANSSEEIEISGTEYPKKIDIDYGDALGNCINRRLGRSENGYCVIETSYIDREER